MAGEQTTVEDFVGRTTETSALFRLSDDPFVNEGAAEIGRQLANEGLVNVTQTCIEIAQDVHLETVTDWIESLFKEVLQNTHRRTTVAHQVNAALEAIGSGSNDDRWIPSPNVHFPNRAEDDLTVYPNDEIDIETLQSHGIPDENIDYVTDDPSSLYQLSPTYVGHPSGHKFEYQFARYERYLDTYLSTITDEFDADDPACMLCGSEEMPTTKGVGGDDLEFNQSFNIRSTASGTAVPLGMGGRTTSHSGRCVACLLAGFYYTLMSKVVRYKDRESRGGSFDIPVYNVFTPRGDLEELVGIRSDFDQDLLTWIDKPTSNGRTRRGTLPVVSNPSRGLQALQFYEAVLRYVNKEITQEYYEYTVEHHPTALVSYTTASMKSGNPIRDISQIETIDPGIWGYGAMRQRSVSTGDDDSIEYWPFDELLEWYARLDTDTVAVETLDDIGYGILERDLTRLARGHFEVAKALEQTQGAAAPYVPSIRKASDYFSHIMQQTTADTTDRIDEEAIESIKRVASNVGQTFYERDDISVLIALQNASTSDEFLAAFEKASMQAQKKASTDEAGSNSWSGQNDVAQVLKLITDPQTFEQAKRMFVIHASLSAQYMNAQRGNEGGD